MPQNTPTALSVDRRVDRVAGELESHERECLIRYTNIEQKMETFGRRTSRIEVATWGVLATVLIALMGFVFKLIS